VTEVSFEDSVLYWQNVAKVARQGAAPTATAMAKHIAERAQKVTLARTKKPSGAWHRARPGEPPALSTGKLGDAMYYIPARRGGVTRAFAWVGNEADYARITEFGCVISALNKEEMHWKDSGSPVKGWFHKVLEYPPHPYLSPTTEEAVDDGSLRDAAIDEFHEYDP
jgi:hypothetical protein